MKFEERGPALLSGGIIFADMVHPQGQLPIEEIESPLLNAHLFEFCDSEYFPETLQYSEVCSNSNCCYEEQSSYPTNHSFTSDMNIFSNHSIDNHETNPSTTTTTTTLTSTNSSNISSTITANNIPNTNNLSLLFDSPEDIENDIISASIDFTSSPPTFTVPQFLTEQQDQQFDISLLNNEIQLADVGDGSLTAQYNPDPSGLQHMAPPLPSVYEGECLSSVPSNYMRPTTLAPSCSFLDPTLRSYFPGSLSVNNSGMLTGGGLFLGSEFGPHDLDFQGDNGGFFCPDTMQRVYNCTTDLQALTSEGQHLIKGRASSTPLSTEITNLEDSTFKVGKLSAEERKEKIHRYMKKRNERNFSKKIKYACRKTLADSRPRVRGRFAKNDELLEAARDAIMNNEDDTDDDCQQGMVVKEEDDIGDSSDIFANINEVNSFKCNNQINPLPAWI